MTTIRTSEKAEWVRPRCCVCGYTPHREVESGGNRWKILALHYERHILDEAVR